MRKKTTSELLRGYYTWRVTFNHNINAWINMWVKDYGAIIIRD